MDKVLIAPTALVKVEAKFVQVLRDGGFELVYHGIRRHQLNEDHELLVAKLDGIRATVAGSEPYTAKVFAAHPQLRAVARVGVGYDAVDLAAATAHGVAVTFAAPPEAQTRTPSPNTPLRCCSVSSRISRRNISPSKQEDGRAARTCLCC